MWVLESNIVIGLYVLDMWSVLFVMCVCGYWTCGQCCVFRMWVVGSNIVIGLYVLDMWSVLCVPYVGGGI
ncbi:hypothetical protein NP493_2048g00015 [Ridgeia piscesae]|uniref:Uncharacterized protein n=1 Tax=Ridgeia piscesae TaxID=27915 RepID=A0AAD9N3D8_RIDPI|nr:hypothetical protein NP493_2048g00015 [Ridgeia piscesae]